MAQAKTLNTRDNDSTRKERSATMATIVKSKPSSVKPTTVKPTTVPSRRLAVAKPTLSLSLPEGPSDPMEDLGAYSILLWGEKKIGKTLLASKFPGAMFLMFEPGGKGSRIAQRACPDWEHFVGYIDLLEGKHPYQTVVVDTGDVAYEKCFKHVATREKFKHPNELEWGEGWDAIRKEFEGQFERIYRLQEKGIGIIVTSHAEVANFKSRTGGSYSKLVPSMGKAARKYVSGISDIIMYAGYYGTERMLTIEGSDAVEAGHRIEERFWVASGKERVHSIPMGKDANEAYKNLLLAFNNGQKDRNEPEDDTMLTETPAVRQKQGRR